MSTLNVSNITDGTDTVETGFVLNGSAKCWVNFTSITTTAVRDSFNVSSLTDQTTGQTEVNFTSSMANTNYKPDGWSNSNSAYNNFSGNAQQGIGTSHSSMNGMLTGSCSYGSYQTGSGYTDSQLIFFSVHGDLA